MRENYLNYSNFSQAPGSAKLNTELMFDALIEYVNS